MESGQRENFLNCALDFYTAHQRAIIGVGVASVAFAIVRRYMSGGRADLNVKLDGKVMIVTGSNSGIGLETAKALAARGATVVLACRNPNRAADAVHQVKSAIKSAGSGGRVLADQLELSSTKSIRQFVENFLAEHNRLDVLINNAAVGCPESKTEDGFEMQFGVNHLGHYLLTRLLLPLMERTGGARVVNVSSLGHKSGKMHWDNLNLTGEYTQLKAYAQSKLANVLFSKAIAEKAKNVTSYSLHPGAVNTNLLRNQPRVVQWLYSGIAWLMFKSPEQGAQTSLHCAVAPLGQLKNGGYYSDCKLVKRMVPQVESVEDAMRLWEISEQMLGLKQE